jgi:hypothetical protein
MRHAGSVLTLLLLFFLAPGRTAGHARLLQPVPRTPLTLKVGPCGGVPRTNHPLVVAAGASIDVEYEEYIDHPGYYRILFSLAGDKDFIVLADNLPDKKPSAPGGVSTYRTTVTLPSTPTDTGTLLLIQVMTEIPSSPRLYYSCADIRLVDPARPAFRRGDSTADGAVDVSDAVSTFAYLFLGGDGPGCVDAADANGDGKLDLSDGVAVLAWLFLGGALAPPGPTACGIGDESPLDCAGYPPCG